jgi:hypothetical protein
VAAEAFIWMSYAYEGVCWRPGFSFVTRKPTEYS